MRDALLLILALLIMDKSDFITAMGGASTPVGTGSATAADLASVLESLIDHLTRPGSRVYNRGQNQQKFWHDLVTVLE